MATNLAIDEELLKEAQKVGNHKTKKETVNEALKEYIQRKKQTFQITERFSPDSSEERRLHLSRDNQEQMPNKRGTGRHH